MEMRLSPQEIKQWCLSDLVEIVSYILSKNDAEIYSMYCNKNNN